MAKQAIERIKRFIHFLQHDLWHIEVESNSKLHRFGVEALRVTHLVVKGLREDNCSLHAAALTFRTLMALIPLLAIIISFAQALGFNTVRDFITSKMAEMPSQFQTFVNGILDDISNVNLAGTLGISGVIFIYVIFKLLSSIEESFNQIWRVQSPRNITDKLRNYLSVLVVAPALMILAQASQTFLDRIGTGPALTLVIQLGIVLVTMIALILLFLFLPNTNVSFKAAATGGAVSALLAIIFQMLMVALATAIASRFRVYGSLATLLVFLFWLSINWTILLFGAELSFAIQHRETYREERRAVRASTLSKLWVGIALVKEAVRVLNSPETSLDAIAFSRSNNIPLRLINEMMQLFIAAGLMGELSSEEPNHYVLLQAPENITSKQIFDLLISDGTSPEELGLKDSDVSNETLSILGITS